MLYRPEKLSKLKSISRFMCLINMLWISLNVQSVPINTPIKVKSGERGFSAYCSSDISNS